jgi:hypothetical protein
MPRIKALLDFVRTTPGDLLVRANAVYAGLYDSKASHHPSPPSSMIQNRRSEPETQSSRLAVSCIPIILGDRFSGLVAIQPGHTLVTDGIYSIIRHPSYLGLFLVSLGWVLAFRSGVGLVLTACLIPPLLARIRAEEALLLDQFGDEYRTYRSRTSSRLIPGIY